VTTRRKVLAGLLGTAAAAYPVAIEPRWLDVNRRRVRLARVPMRSPVRVLHLSDFHASFVVPLSMIEHAIAVGLAGKPDVICLTGDFITQRGDAPAARDYIRILRPLARHARTFAVLGNHDGGRWAAQTRGWEDHAVVERILEESGIELLHNRSRAVEIRGQRLALAGVGDYWAGEVDGAGAFRDVDARLPVLLMAHNPDTKDVLDEHPWDLMLSGHTHGGQILVPFYGAPFRAVEDTRYMSGLKPYGARQIHVTRGVGNLLGVRINCRPEVSLLEVG